MKTNILDLEKYRVKCNKPFDQKRIDLEYEISCVDRVYEPLIGAQAVIESQELKIAANKVKSLMDKLQKVYKDNYGHYYGCL